jgi:hypothetical protein
MSTRSKSARGKLPVVELPLTATKTSARPAPRPKNRLAAPPTTNAEKDLLADEYAELYDKGDAFKADVIAAKDRTIVRAGKAFNSVLVRCLIIPIPHRLLISP